jgi:hypothetical protein
MCCRVTQSRCYNMNIMAAMLVWDVLPCHTKQVLQHEYNGRNVGRRCVAVSHKVRVITFEHVKYLLCMSINGNNRASQDCEVLMRTRKSHVHTRQNAAQDKQKQSIRTNMRLILNGTHLSAERPPISTPRARMTPCAAQARVGPRCGPRIP